MTISMTSAVARPRLKSKVRLRFDRRTGRSMLLYPETGLVLNKTATEIARLCTGEWTVADIVLHLARSYGDGFSVEIKRDVGSFLQALASRGLLTSQE